MTAAEPDVGVRRGRPSASALGRLSKCPASWGLSRAAAVAGIVEPENEDAASGTRIHKALDLGCSTGLSPDEAESFERCCRQRRELVVQWLADKSSQENPELAFSRTEVRHWLEDDDDNAIFSGQTDQYYIIRDDSADPDVCHALVIDYKTGRGEYESAAGNAQLAGLAVLMEYCACATHVRVAIVQPWAGKPSVADFDGPALDEAKSQLLALLKHIEEPGLVPVPGDWCQYCPARLCCPALNREAKKVAVQTALLSQGDLANPAQLESLTASNLAAALSVRKRLRWWMDAIEAEAKRRLESNSPDAPEGWCLTDGRKTRTITNLAEAFGILNAEFGMTPERMMAACKASLPEIEADVAKHVGISKMRAAQQVEAALGTLIEYGRTAPSLAEKKPERAQLEVAS